MEKPLSKLLPIRIYNEIAAVCSEDKLTEIRLRKDKPLSYACEGIYRILPDDITVSTDDIAYVLACATKSSLYAYNSSILQGYVTYEGGIRIGLSGEGVTKGDTLTAIKNINSLCIRIPHYVEIRDRRIDALIENFDNTLIVSRPGMGKTTLLRYMIKRLSDKGNNMLVLDERGELSGASQGEYSINLGNCTDIVTGIPKITAYSSQVRSMRPDIIASDEIFGEKEVDCIADCVRCGVKVLASLHTTSTQLLKKDKTYDRLLNFMRYVLIIKGIGDISAIVDLRGENA